MTDVKALLWCRYGWFIGFFSEGLHEDLEKCTERCKEECESENWCSYPSAAVGENTNISGSTKDKSTVHLLSV